MHMQAQERRREGASEAGDGSKGIPMERDGSLERTATIAEWIEGGGEAFV